MADKYKIESCGRCSGSGVYHFSAGSGNCFRCNGTGKVRVNISAIKRKESAERNRMNRGQNNRVQFAAEHPDLAILNDYGAISALNNPFLIEMRSKIFNYGTLTDRQLDVVRETIQRQMERNQAKEAAKAAQIERSKHIGQIGERTTAALTYKCSISRPWRIHALCNDRRQVLQLEDGLITDKPVDRIPIIFKFGHFFETADGSVVVWWTTSTDLSALEKGTVINAKFTVKKHDVYKDVNQTQVSRLTF